MVVAGGRRNNVREEGERENGFREGRFADSGRGWEKFARSEWG